MNHMAEMMEKGEPISNTVKLRNEYMEYRVNKEANGEEVVSFEEWVTANYPEKPIMRMR